MPRQHPPTPTHTHNTHPHIHTSPPRPALNVGGGQGVLSFVCDHAYVTDHLLLQQKKTPYGCGFCADSRRPLTGMVLLGRTHTRWDTRFAAPRITLDKGWRFTAASWILSGRCGARDRRTGPPPRWCQRPAAFSPIATRSQWSVHPPATELLCCYGHPMDNRQ